MSKERKGGRRFDAVVIRWVDGDTVDLNVDLGFSIWAKHRFRLIGVDAPDRGHPKWKEAREAATQMAPPGARVEVVSYKTEKYGRYLAEVIREDGFEVGDRLAEAGLSVRQGA